MALDQTKDFSCSFFIKSTLSAIEHLLPLTIFIQFLLTNTKMISISRTVSARTRLSRSFVQTAKTFASESKVADKQETKPESSPLSLYCWGTDEKGSIPTKDILQEARSSGSGGLLNRGGTVIDHPVKIDVQDATGKNTIDVSFSKL